jgi:hypothetical protein
MPAGQKSGWGTVLVVAVLVGLLGLAIYMGIAGWSMGSDTAGSGMSITGFIAMGLGIAVTLALGVGLMGLMYYSSKHDRD